MKENEEIENPPAFPIAIPGDEKAGWLPEHHEGMTLRDYFAAKALIPLGAAYGYGKRFDEAWHAESAYKMSDAMLKERNKTL